MRAENIRIYKSLHTWTGIISGLALFIAFYAGALTMFKEPIARWAAPPIAGISATPLASVNVLIQQTLEKHPQAAEGFTIHLENKEHIPARMHWHEAAEGADDHDLLKQKDYSSRFSDDGSVIVEPLGLSKLSEFIDVLHRVVGLPVDTDLTRIVMGVFSVLYVLALVSGLIIILPTLTKDFFALRLGKKNLKRQWLDAHNVVGIASLPFHLVIGLTAAVFAFHDPIYAAQSQLIHEKPLREIFQASRPSPLPRVYEPSELRTVEEMLESVAKIAPNFEPTSVEYVRINTPRAMVRLWGNDTRSFGPRAMGGFAVINPFTAEVIETEYVPVLQDAANSTLSSFFALHFGTYGGTPVRWVYFLLGLAGAWLFYSGNLLWVETRRKRQRRGKELPEQRRDTWLMAALTVGVSLGAVAGISLMIVMQKWVSAFGVNELLSLQTIYYSIFFCFIIWALMQGGARAAEPMLRITALVTAAIPITSLLAWMFPDLGMWTHTSAATLGVDVTALAGALCFLSMARAAKKRVQEGGQDSVWSAVATTQ